MAFEDLRIEMKCKDFRIEVEEGLKGDSLSIVAQDHAAGCRPCHEFNQKHIEFREWLTVCRKVTAPKDFQFGVQRKIARAGDAHAHGWAWERLRYIVPATALTAVLVMVGLYLFNIGTFPNSGPGVATLDTNVSDTARTAPDEARASENIDKPESSKPGEEIAAANSGKQESNSRIAVPKENVDPNKGGGSLVRGAENVPPPALPQGLQVSPNGGRSNTLIALSKRGIITSVDFKVIGLKPNAEASGVRIGDVVKNLSGNTVTVERNGQTLQITLK